MTLADQIAIRIVHSIFGPVDPVTNQHILQAAHTLAQPPDGRLFGLALFCRRFLNAYANWNYDWRTNGEQWLVQRLAALRPSVVFDVGANVGNWLELARNAMPQSQFHAFEIVETTFAELRKRMAGKPGLTLNDFGLSDRFGELTMHLFDAGSELTSHVAYPHGSSRRVACRVHSGDDYMREKGIERIDLLKIDVEGAEHLVLNGLRAALAEGRIEVIQFEYGKVNIITHFLLRDFYELLGSYGYAVGKLFPNHVDFRSYALEDEDFLGPNYVAVRMARSDIIDALGKH
jgi:FkbM family methyltransferase